MEQLGVLIPLNDYLTVKSAAILRVVSKTCKNYIEVKKFSFYSLFKKLEIDELNVIKMLLKSDKVWMDHNSVNFGTDSINIHKHGNEIKRYIERTEFYDCITDFEKKLDEELIISDPSDFYFPGHTIDEHCADYTDYYPLYEILITICYEKI
jgi:hypothetical protein